MGYKKKGISVDSVNYAGSSGAQAVVSANGKQYYVSVDSVGATNDEIIDKFLETHQEFEVKEIADVVTKPGDIGNNYRQRVHIVYSDGTKEEIFEGDSRLENAQNFLYNKDVVADVTVIQSSPGSEPQYVITDGNGNKRTYYVSDPDATKIYKDFKERQKEGSKITGTDETLGESGNVDIGCVDYTLIANTAQNCQDGKYLPEEAIHKEYWEDGNLTYQKYADGVYMVLDNGVPMGFVPANAIIIGQEPAEITVKDVDLFELREKEVVSEEAVSDVESELSDIDAREAAWKEDFAEFSTVYNEKDYKAARDGAGSQYWIDYPSGSNEEYEAAMAAAGSAYLKKCFESNPDLVKKYGSYENMMKEKEDIETAKEGVLNDPTKYVEASQHYQKQKDRWNEIDKELKDHKNEVEIDSVTTNGDGRGVPAATRNAERDYFNANKDKFPEYDSYEDFVAAEKVIDSSLKKVHDNINQVRTDASTVYYADNNYNALSLSFGNAYDANRTMYGVDPSTCATKEEFVSRAHDAYVELSCPELLEKYGSADALHELDQYLLDNDMLYK